ncbi:MAG: recombinase family protein [Acutalibacteraceae bacterium]|nr:recombinase family protein [Acutalibacteraceae bacterium]
MKTAAAYIRVSTDDQVEYSPASQLEKIREYAKRNGYILPDEYIFMDEGISGRNTAKRAAFNKMIGTAKQKPKPFDAILLWKFSRFARNREDSIVYKSMLRKQCGIDVISISENVGDDKMSVLIEALIEAMDEYYSINLSEEVKRGMTEKASRGEAVSIPSFGYLIENGKYIPDPDTALIVRKIYNDYLDGIGMRTIAVELNNSGIRTRRGNPFENRTIKYILQNPVYIGKIRWNNSGKANYHSVRDPEQNTVDGSHEPIIDKETWNKVQEKLRSEGGVKYMRSTISKEPFMLQGLCRCSACGATLCQAVNHTSLQCHAYAHGKCKTSHSISIKKINAMVIEALENTIGNQSAKIEITYRNKPSAAENVPALIERENKKLKRIREAYENEVYTLEEYRESREAIQRHIDELNRKLIILPRNDNADRIKLMNKMIAILPSLKSPAVPEEYKNSLLKSFVDRIVFYRATCDIDIFFYI